MTPDGYPDEMELDRIEKWEWQNVFDLLDFIEDRWVYRGFRRKWGKDRQRLHKKPVLFIEMHTAGWSGNEELINTLLGNRMAMMVMGYYKWEAGGHYYFQINPEIVGFKPVSAIAEELKISRQYIHKTKDNFEWLTVGQRNQFIRKKQNQNEHQKDPAESSAAAAKV